MILINGPQPHTSPKNVKLSNQLRAIADAEIAQGNAVFMGWPDRWYDPPGPLKRCINNHVSSTVLKSEQHSGDLCLACHELVHFTFPEDKDGPLATKPAPLKEG